MPIKSYTPLVSKPKSKGFFLISVIMYCLLVSLITLFITHCLLCTIQTQRLRSAYFSTYCLAESGFLIIQNAFNSLPIVPDLISKQSLYAAAGYPVSLAPYTIYLSRDSHYIYSVANLGPQHRMILFAPYTNQDGKVTLGDVKKL